MRMGIAQALTAMLFFSFVGPIAKLVPLSAGAISFWRAAFASAALLGWILVRSRRKWRIERPDHLASLIGIGLLTCGNWVFYILAVQVSTVAIGVVCLFTYPLWTILLEPFFFDQRHRPAELVGGGLVLAGVALLVERLAWTDNAALGVWFGLLSSFCLTGRNLLSRKAVIHLSPSTVNLALFLLAALVFLPFAAPRSEWPGPQDLANLALLGGVFTMISHVMFIASLRHLTASFASILVSFQPVCAILIAVVMLGERPSMRTLAGGGLILAAVFLALGTRSLPPGRVT